LLCRARCESATTPHVRTASVQMPTSQGRRRGGSNALSRLAKYGSLPPLRVPPGVHLICLFASHSPSSQPSPTRSKLHACAASRFLGLCVPSLLPSARLPNARPHTPPLLPARLPKAPSRYCAASSSRG